jgi:hypothetical protein
MADLEFGGLRHASSTTKDAARTWGSTPGCWGCAWSTGA